MSDRTGCRIDYGESEVETSLSNKTYVFRWRIKNFPDWPDVFRVTSNEFKPAKDIILYATFERFKDTSDTSKSYLKFISKRKSSFEIEDQLSFIDSTGKVFHEIELKKNVCNDHNRISWSYIIYPDKIKEFSKSTKDHIVIFKCTMKHQGLATENAYRHRLKCSKDALSPVIEDFKAMYVDSLYTDFSVLVNNNVLRVHKSVLCARSPVFAKMLKSPMEETAKETIEITDVELSTLKTFVEFLYTGNRPTDVDFDSWCKLYYAADKYDVSSLRETCVDAMLDKLDSENSCHVLSLANRHSDVQLMDVVLDFMQCNFESVMETEAWFELVMSEPELTNRVMRLRVQKAKKSTSN